MLRSCSLLNTPHVGVSERGYVFFSVKNLLHAIFIHAEMLLQLSYCTLLRLIPKKILQKPHRILNNPIYSLNILRTKTVTILESIMNQS